MEKILIITGACGVGKSTISKMWAEMNKGAVIESDYFTEWIFNDIYKKFSAEEEILVADLTFATAKEYIKHNMSVAIDNVWTPQGLQKLKNAFQQEYKEPDIKFIRLKCDIKENHRRDKMRIPENQMKERVDIVNKELSSYNWPDYVRIVNSTHQTARETLEQIENSGFN